MIRWMKFLEEHESEESLKGVDLLQMMELVDEGEKMDPVDTLGPGDSAMSNLNTEVDDGTVQLEQGKKLLQMLEMNDEEGDAPELEKEDQEVLPDKIVERLVVKKTMKQNMKPCEQRKKSKEKKWGPVLVDRPRRNQNTGETVLQKAMQIKKRELGSGER
jgi:hypothetical protein